MKPICIPCQRFFRPKKNDFYFTEGMPVHRPGDDPDEPIPPGTARPDAWAPYKVWAGDRWECEGCGANIVVGVAQLPVAEHYMPGFNDARKQLHADQFQVNDC